jgi:hypothetical protein
MEVAQDLPSYQAALADLDRELLYLSGERLSTAQKNQLEGLQASSRQGHKRVSGEQIHAETVASTSRRIDALTSLPTDQQANEQTSLRVVLEGIPASSFSYPRAKEQLKRFAASATSPAPAPPSAQAPPSEGSQEPESKPAPAPQPAPVPVPSPLRRSEPSSGSSTGSTRGIWAPSPARPAPPTPAHQENGTGNAPYRDDPLF